MMIRAPPQTTPPMAVGGSGIDSCRQAVTGNGDPDQAIQHRHCNNHQNQCSYGASDPDRRASQCPGYRQYVTATT